MPAAGVGRDVVGFAREGGPSGPELNAQLQELGLRSVTFTSKMLDKGQTLEFSANIRGRHWRDMERLLEVLRDDARVLEYELMPRKP